ncbi:trimeric intracellular cation channel family protein [Alginatibacterium sediminis]|uniref:trimeric intracellular cation channel family protein n=1 Tax=Alginatibacterium sediminis TaxID=2164068 RepID=UPI0018F2EA1D|nr:trimeric intracellular cation channel family protein [Alginatibacterium sediminis]
MIYWLDLFGTAVFAITGVLAASRCRMDLFGALVLASVTAIGGGTIRDMALDAGMVFWVQDPLYLWVIVLTSLATMLLLGRGFVAKQGLLAIADAIGMAVFMIIGASKAHAYGAPMIAAMVMGILTACGGGIIRDVLAHQMPLVLRREVYATACLAGGLVWACALGLNLNDNIANLSGIITALTIRLIAIKYHLSLPRLG